MKRMNIFPGVASTSPDFWWGSVLLMFLHLCVACVSVLYIVKKGALDSQQQVIKFTCCLPMVVGSLR